MDGRGFPTVFLAAAGAGITRTWSGIIRACRRQVAWAGWANKPGDGGFPIMFGSRPVRSRGLLRNVWVFGPVLRGGCLRMFWPVCTGLPNLSIYRRVQSLIIRSFSILVASAVLCVNASVWFILLLPPPPPLYVFIFVGPPGVGLGDAF